MNRYEAMIIFPESFNDEALESALEKVSAEVEKLGGKVESKTRLGRRAFARPLKKHNAGQYMVVTFRLDGSKVDTLRMRFKLNEEIFRFQIIRIPEAAGAAA
ncbi:MAG: 30S ribosomal protein S6 [Kiritimatiellae bacterium]|nr:30S ribosomal protein S6 [Kiritimatiellia bacterium]MDW8457636.1 30S ribosomal protein S6 [Verrucomicrobiota bacterium]